MSKFVLLDAPVEYDSPEVVTFRRWLLGLHSENRYLHAVYSLHSMGATDEASVALFKRIIEAVIVREGAD